MKSLRTILVLCAVLFAVNYEATAQVSVTMWQGDLQHTGNNAKETILNPGNVGSPGNFGLLFSQTLDGQTYGQSLMAGGISISGTTHNVVYVATEHCSLYAFDADSNTGNNANPLWHLAMLPTGTVPVPQGVVGSTDIPVELGITTTPVIDTASSTIYIVSKVQRTSDTTYHQYLYALDLATGATKFGSPVEISTSFPGTATPDSSGGVVPFSALREHMRSAMILYNGVVYLSYASHSDTTPYHGEIIGYNATTLQVVKTFITTPNGGNPEGGIWQGGAGPAVDSSGNLYVSVGNGAWDQNNSSYGTNWGESMLKLPTTGTFGVSYSNTLNWFTPTNFQTLNNGDLDLGSGGLLLLPDQTGPHTHILVGGGKGAVLYVVDRDSMGGMHSPDNAIQEIPEYGGDWIFSTPAYYNGYIYYSPAGGPLEQRAVGYNATTGAYISTTPIVSSDVYNVKGSSCFISSNGTNDGIVWILNGSGMKAYNAANVSAAAIYSASATLPGSISCTTTKFGLPMAANGKVYYTAYSNTNVGHLLVYGLLPAAVGTPAAPSNLVAAATSATSIALTWTSNSTNESGFKVKRSTSPTTGFVVVATPGAGVTSFNDIGLTASTTYYYQVVATNANGDSNATNVASALTIASYSENGLVAFWSLDETTGTSAGDRTAYLHTGTVNGEAGFAAGLINNGVNLHGTGQATSNVSVPNRSDLQFSAAQSFTLSTWVYPSALRSSEETIIAKSRDQGNYYGIWINASNQWVFRGPGGDVVGPTATQSAWTHVAVVQDGTAGTRKIYVNGVLSQSGVAQAADGAGALWMGQQNITGNFESFPGTIDEVRLYNRALAASEITTLMAPPVLGAVSNETHGSAGVFGVSIWPYATAKTESRKGATAGQYSLALTFSAPVSGITATLKKQDGTAAVGSIGTVSYDSTGKIVTIPLTGVGDAQMLNVHLAGVIPGNGTIDMPFNVLWGDVNSDHIVNALDLSIEQHSHATGVGSTSAQFDINCDGTITTADDSLVSAAVGTNVGAQIDTNLAVYQPTTALSVNGNNASALAVDNNLTTRWESQQGVDPEWIYVDLGTVCTIHTVVFNWEAAAGKNYTIDVSNDASTWSSILTVTGNTTAGSITYPNLTGTGRYVRMYGTARATVYGYSLYDFQVIGLSSIASAPVPTITSGATATATVGSAFSYQIVATNSPTSYAASSLPAGLTPNTSTGLISGTPTQAGTFNASISATNAAGTTSTPLTITVLTPFAGWQSTYFTAADLANSAISGPLATPAGDGITNLMKYALNLNPKVSGVSGLPTESITATGGQNYLTLTYTKVISATDITYTVEVSSSMATWNSGSSYTATPTVTNNADGKTQTVIVRDLTQASGTATRFIRLKVTSP